MAIRAIRPARNGLEIRMVDPSLIPYGLAVRQTLVSSHTASTMHQSQGDKAAKLQKFHGRLWQPATSCLKPQGARRQSRRHVAGGAADTAMSPTHRYCGYCARLVIVGGFRISVPTEVTMATVEASPPTSSRPAPPREASSLSP